MGHVCVHGFGALELMHTCAETFFLFCFLFLFRVGVYSAVLRIVVLSGCGFYTAKRLTPPLCVALLWQWYTVGFLRATGGGWVHTVNYTSSPLVWFIALITVGSLKKEKGEEAYKIKKKRLKVPRWQRERENCVRVHVGAVGLHEPDIVYCCKLLWGSHSQLTVATTERQWRRRSSEHRTGLMERLLPRRLA